MERSPTSNFATTIVQTPLQKSAVCVHLTRSFTAVVDYIDNLPCSRRCRYNCKFGSNTILDQSERKTYVYLLLEESGEAAYLPSFLLDLSHSPNIQNYLKTDFSPSVQLVCIVRYHMPLQSLQTLLAPLN